MAIRPLLIVFMALAASSQVVITEINRDPFGGATAIPGGASHEFVEITNFDSDTFSIDSLYLTDGVEIDAIVAWPRPLEAHPDCITGTTLLPPGAMALILDRNYDSAVGIAPSSRYDIRPNCVLLTTEDSDLGNSLAGDDGVMMYKGTKTAITRIVWCAADTPYTGTTPPKAKITLSASAPKGFSVVPTSFLSGTSRYTVCADSITPGSFELLKSNWFAEWRFGEPDTIKRTFACSLACIKAGTLPKPPIRFRVTLQSRTGTAAATATEVTCALSGNRGFAAMELPLDTFAYYLHLIEQENETSWQLDVSQVYTTRSPLKINELFPRATPGEPEWIEVCNTSPMPVNIKNWTFGNSESFDTITAIDLVLAPGDFLVLASNGDLFRQRYPAKSRIVVPAHWHTLDNYNDTLCLWDADHHLKETACYRSTWFAGWSYQSLERTSPSASGTDATSWLPAASPTPGQPNIALFLAASTQPGLKIGPTPFTPNGDGRDDLLSITVEQGQASSASLAIYGFSGHKLREFRAPLAHQLLWDGKQDNGSPAPTGPFIVVLETHSAKGVSYVRKRGVLWR